MTNDFTQNGSGKRIVPFWVWAFLLILFLGMLMQFFMWFWYGRETAPSQAPFYQVTNRDMSLFLWQNPEFLMNRTNISRNLPGFDQQDQVALDPQVADQMVIAPPEVLFRYHTWDRLLRKEFSNTPIPVDEFLKFLAYAKEWLPDNWPDAPEKYRALIPELPKRQITELNKIPFNVLPLEVRIAFQGWLNSSQMNDINKVQITYQDYFKFLLKRPHYSRNFWRNIVPGYIGSLAGGNVDQKAEIPSSEVPSFLKIAFFNLFQNGAPPPPQNQSALIKRPPMKSFSLLSS